MTTLTGTVLSSSILSVTTPGMAEAEITSTETVLSPSPSSIATIKSCLL
jgi:hypothetical protein